MKADKLPRAENVPVFEEPGPSTHIGIRLKVQRCEEVKPGEWVAWVPARILTEAEHEAIRNLFPHLGDKAYDLLNREAILAAVL